MLERRDVAMLLVLTFVTGIIDATCLLHLGVFTAYLTGAVIIFGAHLGGISGPVLPSATAIVMFVLGAIVGLRFLRHRGVRMRAAVLALEALLVVGGAAVAAVFGLQPDHGEVTTIAVLALAMGLQMAVIREANVPDFALAAATVAIYNLIAGTGLGQGEPFHTGRRVGIIACLAAGASFGALLSRWEPWASFALAGAVLAGAAVFEIISTNRLLSAVPPSSE